MKKNIKLKTPPWIKFPELSEFTMGWRMGYGETYLHEWRDWCKTLSPEQLKRIPRVISLPLFLASQQLATSSN